MVCSVKAGMAAPLIDQGIIRGAVVTFSDVTERRQLERRVEQVNRIDSLGRMAATIAHEFNNVLMGIQPFAEVIRRKGTGDPGLQKAADHIRGRPPLPRSTAPYYTAPNWQSAQR